jgi:hypothetical protein
MRFHRDVLHSSSLVVLLSLTALSAPVLLVAGRVGANTKGGDGV